MLLDRYIAGVSPIHRLDARVKVALAVAYIVCASLLPVGAWLALLCLTALAWLAIVVSGVGVWTIGRRALVGLPFLLVAITVIWSVPGAPVLRVPLGFATLTATDAGLARFATIMWKGSLSVVVALLLSSTTHFLSVLGALRAFRLPRILVAILGLMYRYMFVLVDEAQRLQRARVCRSAATDGRGGGTLWWRARVTGQMAGTLLVRSFERSERIYVAMLARGYRGDLRVLDTPAVAATDLRIGLGAGVLLVLIVVQAYLGQG
jgi:cobalt/nickel transport system permease protein